MKKPKVNWEDILKRLESDLLGHGPLVLWDGGGEFPGKASGLRGLAYGRKGLLGTLAHYTGGSDATRS